MNGGLQKPKTRYTNWDAWVTVYRPIVVFDVSIGLREELTDGFIFHLRCSYQNFGELSE
jgi:hypothetical protein